MSRLFDAYYFSDRYQQDQERRIRQEEQSWQQYEEELQIEAFKPEPACLFTLEDGTVLEG